MNLPLKGNFIVMSRGIASIDGRKGGAGLPLAIFALLCLVGTLLPTRERALLPLDSRDLVGFLAQSAADEQMPGGFRDDLDDPVKRLGLTNPDRAAALLNPVLRAGGAADRARGRRALSRGRGGTGRTTAQPGSAALPVLPADGGDPETLALGPGQGTSGGSSAPGGSGSNPGGNSSSGGPPGGSSGGGVTTLALIDPLPEPATWLMMIVGFAAVGHALRRHRRISSSAAKVTEAKRAIAS